MPSKNIWSKQQLKIADEAAKAQIAAQQAHLDQQRVLTELKNSQVDALHVRAGLAGVLSAVSVEVGPASGAGHEPGARGRSLAPQGDDSDSRNAS